MALSHTCKAHALDELSLILWIENEVTRNHGVQTMEEAIAFCKGMYHPHSRWRPWLVCSDPHFFRVTGNLLMGAVSLHYDAMLAKLLQTIRTESRRIRMVNERDLDGYNLLQYAARTSNVECIKAILSVYPESMRLQALSTQSKDGRAVLHFAVLAGNLAAVDLILALYPESEHLQAVTMRDANGGTPLHCAARSDKSLETIKLLLNSLPESQRVEAVNIQDQNGDTALQLIQSSVSRESIMELLSYPKGEGKMK